MSPFNISDKSLLLCERVCKQVAVCACVCTVYMSSVLEEHGDSELCKNVTHWHSIHVVCVVSVEKCVFIGH